MKLIYIIPFLLFSCIPQEYFYPETIYCKKYEDIIINDLKFSRKSNPWESIQGRRDTAIWASVIKVQNLKNEKREFQEFSSDKFGRHLSNTTIQFNPLEEFSYSLELVPSLYWTDNEQEHYLSNSSLYWKCLDSFPVKNTKDGWQKVLK